MNKMIAIAFIAIIGILNAESFTMVKEDANISELRGVFAFSNGTVWAVGTDGNVLKSTNWGNIGSWNPVTISGATDYHLNAVFFSDANNGCIVGEKKAAPDRFKGIVYKTTNGGSNWSIVTSITTAADRPFRDIAFDIRDGGFAYNGLIAAGQGYLYSTTDYGQTWTSSHPGPNNVCLQRVTYNLASSGWMVVGDAGTGTGIVVSSDAGVEYPYPGLGLNFFGVGSYGDFGIAASKGYCLKKYGGSWSNTHNLPDQNVLYGLGSISGFGTLYMYGGSDEAFGLMNGSVINHYYGKGILYVSPTKTSGYGPALICSNAFAVGKNGRIYKYIPDDDPWPATMNVYGEYHRVRCEIWDSEEPSYAYIYRSTCPDGPYQFVADFDIPVGASTWYDNTVDFNVAYYYRIGNLPASNNPAYPTGLPNPANPPQPPPNFTAQDAPYDDGGRVYTTWYWQLETTYALYRDGVWIYVGVGSEYWDNAAVTGSNHTYSVRTRKYYTAENDYIYSSPVTVNCTPVNNLTPSAPSSLTGERHWDTGIINMRWTAPSNVDIHGYNVYRKIGNNSYGKVNNIPAPRCFWWDEPNSGNILKYKVTTVDWSGLESGYSNEIVFSTHGDSTLGGSQASESTPAGEIKLIVSPNPSRGTQTIRFSIPEPAPVRFAFYDVAGKLVQTADLGVMNAGEHSYTPTNTTTPVLPSGVYFVVLNAGGIKMQERCVIWR
jgi:hypothetical protein